jgi:hypothetical protein
MHGYGLEEPSSIGLCFFHPHALCCFRPRRQLSCDQLERFLNSLGGGGGGGGGFRGKKESGKENPYSCLVLAGQRG